MCDVSYAPQSPIRFYPKPQTLNPKPSNVCQLRLLLLLAICGAPILICMFYFSIWEIIKTILIESLVGTSIIPSESLYIYIYVCMYPLGSLRSSRFEHPASRNSTSVMAIFSSRLPLTLSYSHYTI